jgi:hypothetical protein
MHGRPLNPARRRSAIFSSTLALYARLKSAQQPLQQDHQLEKDQRSASVTLAAYATMARISQRVLKPAAGY